MQHLQYHGRLEGHGCCLSGKDGECSGWATRQICIFGMRLSRNFWFLGVKFISTMSIVTLHCSCSSTKVRSERRFDKSITILALKVSSSVDFRLVCLIHRQTSGNATVAKAPTQHKGRPLARLGDPPHLLIDTGGCKHVAWWACDGNTGWD